ncbi:MAG: response regulator [Beijerinckiaceae bacterium]|jgi:two-component system, chemotaxis family, chemotaxis protein CheY|nr:response regulator [Beijerinckiaceae bacterium]
MNPEFSDTILVVDDVTSMRQVIRTCLKQIGYQNVDEACDGAEALAMAKEKSYQWILSDWHMTPVNGPQFMEQLINALGENAPKVVFITMDGDWNVMNFAKDLGAYRLIVKPLRPSALKASIENVLLKTAA